MQSDLKQILSLSRAPIVTLSSASASQHLLTAPLLKQPLPQLQWLLPPQVGCPSVRGLLAALVVCSSKLAALQGHMQAFAPQIHAFQQHLPTAALSLQAAS